jgi:hypothetical protein
VILQTAFSTDGGTVTGLGDGVKTSLVADAVTNLLSHSDRNIFSPNAELGSN